MIQGDDFNLGSPFCKPRSYSPLICGVFRWFCVDEAFHRFRFMPPNVTSWCYTYDCAVCNPNIKDDDTVFEYFDDDLPPLEDDPDTLSVGPPFYSDHQSLQNTTVHGTPQSNYKARPDNTTSQNNGYELVSLGIVNGFDQDDYPELRAIEVRDLGYEAEIQCSQLEYDLENNKIAFFFLWSVMMKHFTLIV